MNYRYIGQYNTKSICSLIWDKKPRKCMTVYIPVYRGKNVVLCWSCSYLLYVIENGIAIAILYRCTRLNFQIRLLQFIDLAVTDLMTVDMLIKQAINVSNISWGPTANWRNTGTFHASLLTITPLFYFGLQWDTILIHALPNALWR